MTNLFTCRHALPRATSSTRTKWGGTGWGTGGGMVGYRCMTWWGIGGERVRYKGEDGASKTLENPEKQHKFPQNPEKNQRFSLSQHAQFRAERRNHAHFL